jgi:hypothetical protein
MKNRIRALTLVHGLLLAPVFGLLLIGGFFALASLIQAFLPVASEEEAEWYWLLITGLVFLIPGIVSQAYRKRLYRRIELLEGLHAACNFQSTLPISQISKQLDLEESAMRHLLHEAVSQGWIVGQLDPKFDIFYPNRKAEDFSTQEITCDSCKAEVAVRVTPDAIPNCPFCGASLARELKTQG